MQKDKNDVDRAEVKIEGFDAELNGLPSVALSLALYDTQKVREHGDYESILELIIKARRYLNLLFDVAVTRHEPKELH